VQRLFSKILASRLQPHMNKLLTQTQTGFLKGRNIVHGFHYTQELVVAVTRQGARVGIFKADIHKAFDSIAWEFLIKCLKASGFADNWIQWIVNLVLQGTSKVIINSVAGRSIKLRRGVRQCDPLSPYLFNIAIDFLTRWISKLNELQLLTAPFLGCRTCLLYADDTLIFFSPQQQQI
jgi:Reverse transcriptase (RNA-dependent DNA polymerase)